MTISKPVHIAVAVVERGPDVLIGRRPLEVPLGGLWEFPGGKLRPGETPDNAACRECQEETGLEIRILRYLKTVDHSYPHGNLRLHFLLAEPLDADRHPAEPFRWVPRAVLSQYTFPPANAAIVDQLVGS